MGLTGNRCVAVSTMWPATASKPAASKLRAIVENIAAKPRLFKFSNLQPVRTSTLL